MKPYWTVRLTGVADFQCLKAAILQHYPQASVRALESEDNAAVAILPQEYWVNTGVADNSDSLFFNELRHNDLFMEYYPDRVEE